MQFTLDIYNVLYEWNFVHALLCMYCTLCVHYGIITIMKRYAFQFTGIAQIIEHKRNFTRVRANHSKQKSRAQNAGFPIFFFLFSFTERISLFISVSFLNSISLRLPALSLYGYFLFLTLRRDTVHWTKPPYLLLC